MRDAFWLLVFVLLFVATGLGLRDPWPADEPRFALIARDMVQSGDWLFPRVGGDLYHDKPPLYFWLLAAGYWVTGSIRASFLIPSFLAAFGILALVYDLARRLFNRESALAAAGLLACTVQFLMVTRGAQIDATLCFMTTLSLYGLLRHLLLGPAWGWYFIGGLAAGLGVITKGVGFLPLLVLLPYVGLRHRGFLGLPQFEGGWRWTLAGLGFLGGVAVWLIPMLVAVGQSHDPQLIAYRDGILLQQTVQRYAAAWHHVQPWYYFLVEVIPALWLPASLLLFWLAPRWKAALRERDARIWLPLAWVLLAILFFSASAGKRGIYIFPALPAFALAASPYLPDLFRRRAVQYLGAALAALMVLAALVVASGRVSLPKTDFDLKGPLYAFAVSGLLLGLIAWYRRPLLVWPAVLVCLTLVWSYLITPRIDAERSGRGFMRRVLAQAPHNRELALAAAKEQFFLYLDRPVVNFGRARWREPQREAADAARWLNAAPGRVLLAPQSLLRPCFDRSLKRSVGVSSRETWSLVELPVNLGCVARGDANHVVRYLPTP